MKILFDVIHGVVIALGLLMTSLILLNGFDLWATIHFIDNFTSRMLAAEGSRAMAYENTLKIILAATTVLIVVVRTIDKIQTRKQVISIIDVYDQMSNDARSLKKEPPRSAVSKLLSGSNQRGDRS